MHKIKLSWMPGLILLPTNIFQTHPHQVSTLFLEYIYVSVIRTKPINVLSFTMNDQRCDNEDVNTVIIEGRIIVFLG